MFQTECAIIMMLISYYKRFIGLRRSRVNRLLSPFDRNDICTTRFENLLEKKNFLWMLSYQQQWQESEQLMSICYWTDSNTIDDKLVIANLQGNWTILASTSELFNFKFFLPMHRLSYSKRAMISPNPNNPTEIPIKCHLTQCQ